MCSNLTEIVKISLFKENGQKESGMLAIWDKTAPYHESVGTIEYDDTQPPVKYRGSSFRVEDIL